MQGSLDQPPIVFRPSWGKTRRAILVLGAAMALFAADVFLPPTAAANGVPINHSRHAVRNYFAPRIGLVLFGAVFILLVVSNARRRLIADRDGVRLRFVFGERQYRWSDFGDCVIFGRDIRGRYGTTHEVLTGWTYSETCPPDRRKPEGTGADAIANFGAWDMDPAQMVALLNSAKARWRNERPAGSPFLGSG